MVLVQDGARVPWSAQYLQILLTGTPAVPPLRVCGVLGSLCHAALAVPPAQQVFCEHLWLKAPRSLGGGWAHQFFPYVKRTLMGDGT